MSKRELESQFETESGERYFVNEDDIAGFQFMDDGDLFIAYVQGDCDVMRPYVTL